MLSFKNRDKSEVNIPYLDAPYEVGNKVAQLIILPYSIIKLIQVDELSETERGIGGHGSTGA